MMTSVRRVAILGGNRIPFARSDSAYAHASSHDMLTAALVGLIDRFHLQGGRLGEVVAGAVLKHPRDRDLTREAVLSTRLAPETPAYDVQQACGTGLEAVVLVANKIALGQIDAGIAGGVDTTSDAPLALNEDLRKILLELNRTPSTAGRLRLLTRLRPAQIVPEIPRNAEPRTGLSMGEHCAIMASEWGVTREEQDELAARSHRRMAAAYERGFFEDLLTSYLGLERDQNLRPDSTLEKLAKLPPVFGGEDGTMTAGNSSPLSDGASAVLLASEEWARERELPVLAYLTEAHTAAVDHVHKREGLLMAPAYAMPRMLDRAGLALGDFDFYEIHEAFAAQLFDPVTLATRARPDGGEWILSGVKSLVPCAAEAELFVIAADAEGVGPALFVVESSTAGLFTEPEPAMGLRAAATGRLILEDAHVPSGALLGEGRREIYLECVQRARIAWCALAVGSAQAVLDYVIPYVNERVAFGEPISNRQAVAFAVADIAIELEGMRLLTYRAASRADNGKSFDREAALARRLCADKGARIGSDGVQLLGGHGFVKEHPVERWYRDLRATGVMEGALLV
jgi:acetyl-CoA C-acetyltransferase